jgi:hypothetical protein
VIIILHNKSAIATIQQRKEGRFVKSIATINDRWRMDEWINGSCLSMRMMSTDDQLG